MQHLKGYLAAADASLWKHPLWWLVKVESTRESQDGGDWKAPLEMCNPSAKAGALPNLSGQPAADLQQIFLWCSFYLEPLILLLDTTEGSLLPSS